MDGFLQRGYSNGYLYLFKVDRWMWHQFDQIHISMDVLSMPDYIQRDYFQKFGTILTIEDLEEFKNGGLDEKIYTEIRRDLILDNLLDSNGDK